MAERSTQPEAAGGPAPDNVSSTTKPPRTPRWVKVLAIVAIVMVLLVVIALATRPGDHGPGRHRPSGDAGRHAAPAGAAGGQAQLGDRRRLIGSAAAGHARLGVTPIGRTTIAGAADGPLWHTDVPRDRIAFARVTEAGPPSE